MKLKIIQANLLTFNGLIFLKLKIGTSREKITIKNPQLAPLHIDGDPAETSDVFEIEIIENAFKLLIPS